MRKSRISYVYVIQHKITGKKYIGSRCVGKSIDILTKYFTSSVEVSEMLENDPECFSIDKIIVCDSPEDAVDLEDLILRSVDKKDKHRYYNINFSAGGAVIKSQSHIKISNGHTNRLHLRDAPIPEGWYRIKAKPPNRAGYRYYINPETSDILIVRPGESIPAGYVLKTEYDHALMLASPKRVIWITDGKANTKIKTTDRIPDGWRLGKTVKKSTKVRKKRSGPGSTKGRVSITDGTSTRFILPTDPIPEGYRLGTSTKTTGTTGKVCINNGKSNIMIPRDSPIPDGWVKGRLHVS